MMNRIQVQSLPQNKLRRHIPSTPFNIILCQDG